MAEDLEVLVERIYEYTIKLAKDNCVELSDGELCSSGRDGKGAIINLQQYEKTGRMNQSFPLPSFQLFFHFETSYIFFMAAGEDSVSGLQIAIILSTLSNFLPGCFIFPQIYGPKSGPMAPKFHNRHQIPTTRHHILVQTNPLLSTMFSPKG